MTGTLPGHVQTLVVGGGIAGCSTAYHLAKLGRRDVLLLEQGRLTSGTTWHAAGLVGQLRPNRSMTGMSRYGIGLYASLEAETGLATGWKACGAVTVARTPERMQLLHRQAALARSFGVELQVITPREAGEHFPLMRTDDLQGALWIPGDGKVNPTDLTMSLAKGARLHGGAAGRGGAGDRRDRRGRSGRPPGGPVCAPCWTVSRAKSAARRSSTARASGHASSVRSPGSTCRCSRPNTSTS